MLFYLFAWTPDTSPADHAEKDSNLSKSVLKELPDLNIAGAAPGEEFTLSRLSTPHSSNENKLVHLSFMPA